MPSGPESWLQLLIAQEAESLLAISRARQAGQLEEAQQLIREAARRELGMDYGMLTSLDVLSAAELLTHPERVRVLAKLVAEEAAVLQALGRTDEAEERLERADILAEEALRLSNQQTESPWA